MININDSEMWKWMEENEIDCQQHTIFVDKIGPGVSLPIPSHCIAICAEHLLDKGGVWQIVFLHFGCAEDAMGFKLRWL